MSRFCHVTYESEAKPLLQRLPESVPDSAYVAGTKFPCALIEDNCELHLVTSLELQTVLYFLHVEEQFLAFTNFICDEAKLRRPKQIQRKNNVVSIQARWKESYAGLANKPAPDL